MCINYTLNSFSYALTASFRSRLVMLNLNQNGNKVRFVLFLSVFGLTIYCAYGKPANIWMDWIENFTSDDIVSKTQQSSNLEYKKTHSKLNEIR